MAAATVAAIVGAVVAATTSAYQAKKSADDGKTARDQASEQKGAQDKLIQDAKDKQAGEQAKASSDAALMAENAKKSQANIMFGGAGANSTSTLPPIGATAPGKTLLGT